MRIEKLDKGNFEQYMEYLRQAMAEEPDMMTADAIDEEGLRDRINGGQGLLSTSLLAMDGGRVVGRIEYHFYSCLQDGCRMAYVSWVYVLRDFRHRGVAQQLFQAFEADCKKNGINQYYLIQAQNENARRFYGAFEGKSSSGELILRKTFI